MDSKLLAEIWGNHGGKIIGATVGFLLALLILTFGFFRAFFVVVCIVAGYVVGKQIDEKEDIMDIVSKLLPPGYHR